MITWTYSAPTTCICLNYRETSDKGHSEERTHFRYKMAGPSIFGDSTVLMVHSKADHVTSRSCDQRDNHVTIQEDSGFSIRSIFTIG